MMPIWAKKDKERIDADEARRLEEMDFRPSLKMDKPGDYDFEINLAETPRIAKTTFGPCKVVNLEAPLNAEGKKQSVFMSDACYREFVGAVYQKDGIVKVRIHREGLGQKGTRWTCKVL